MCINNFKEGQGGGQCHESITLPIFQNCVICAKSIIWLFLFVTTDTTDEEINVLIQLAKLFPGVKKPKATVSDFVVVVAEVSVLYLFLSPVVFLPANFCPMERSCADKVQSQLVHAKCRSICVVHSIHLMNACCDAPINVKSLV